MFLIYNKHFSVQKNQSISQHFYSFKQRQINKSIIILEKNMRGNSNSPSRPVISGSSNKKQNIENIAHFYLKSEALSSGQVIKKILKDNSNLYKKAIVYSQSVASARQIYNEVDDLLKNKAIIMTDEYKKERMATKWIDFITDGTVLVTNLEPEKLFIYDHNNRGVLYNQNVNFIINQKIVPKQIYLQRINRSKEIASNFLTVINLTTSERQVSTLAEALNIKIQKFISNNSSRSHSRQRKGNSRESPLERNNSRQNQKARNSSKENATVRNTFVPNKSTQNIPKPPINHYKIEESQNNTPKRNSASKREPEKNGDNTRETDQSQRPAYFPPTHKSSSQQVDKRNAIKKQSTRDSETNDEVSLQWIRSNVIGLSTQFTSCLNLNLRAVYVDHTATNRPFRAVENMVQHAKLYAANPHTQFSHFGQYSTDLMKYSRDSLLRSFNSTDGKYVVLPTGAGSTGAIQKAVSFLQNWQSDPSYNWSKPLIFVTPYEHHSNILPWVQFYPTGSIIELVHNNNLTINIKQAEKQLLASKTNCIILSVSAASNVTSKLTHLSELNSLVKKIRQQKKKKIVFCVDCAAFCCHQRLDLKKFDQIDFAFLSPHKNLGGAESCGVLVARNNVIQSDKPTFPGGGTVKFVKGYSKDDIMYEEDNFARQIAGTPPYFGFYRAALSFQLLTDKIGYDFIHRREAANTEYFFRRVSEENKELKNSEIFIYGDQDLNERANVVTFNILDFEENGEHSIVQQNFVSRILNDVFGIQVRSGCFCAGPHGIKLLQMTQTKIERIEQQVHVGVMTNKPGYVRLDLAFYLEQFEVEYIVSAIKIVALYWRNYISTIYDLLKNGQIQVVKGLKKDFIYSLSLLDKAEQIVNRHNLELEHSLKNRKYTLNEQLKKGLEISKNPLLVLKKSQAR